MLLLCLKLLKKAMHEILTFIHQQQSLDVRRQGCIMKIVLVFNEIFIYNGKRPPYLSTEFDIRYLSQPLRVHVIMTTCTHTCTGLVV